MAKDTILSPLDYPGSPGDLGGSGGGAGKPYDDKFDSPTGGGVIPFTDMEKVKGTNYDVTIETPANKGH